MRAIGLLIIGLVSASLGFSQTMEPCASHKYIDALDSMYPGFKSHVNHEYMESVHASKQDQLHKITPLDTVYTIPVVFHVLYNNASENLSDELIKDQLKDLNAAFNRENEDTVNTRPIFIPVAGKARIRFVLATEDPQGQSTDGIVRTFTTRATFFVGNSGQTITNDLMKFSNSGGSDAWDSRKYLNIWICDLRAGASPQLLGYAFPPTGADFWNGNSFQPSNRQGVVVHYQMIGRDNPQAWPRNTLTQEKTIIHEVGHFLGLRHIWGDGFFQQGCFVDDFIDDTPLARTQSFGCNPNQNTCLGDNFPDQIENYMDYSSAECSNMFTAQQVAVMRYNLENLRSNLPIREYVYPPKPDIVGTKFFPNPFAATLKVFIDDLDEDDTYAVEVYDLHGRVVFETALETQYINEMTLTGIAQGMYYAKLYSGKSGLVIQSKVLKIGL